MFKYILIKNLLLNNNQLTQFDVLNFFGQHKSIIRLNIAFNQIDNICTEIEYLNNNLGTLSFDLNFHCLLNSKIRNNRVQKKMTDENVFLLSLNILTPRSHFYGDCGIKLDLLKRNIHFNLLYQFQIDHFLSNCIEFINQKFN